MRDLNVAKLCLGLEIRKLPEVGISKSSGSHEQNIFAKVLKILESTTAILGHSNGWPKYSAKTVS